MANGSKIIGGAQLSGTPTAPTANANTNNTQIATTAFVKTESNTRQKKVGYGTTDKVPGQDSLNTGEMYLVYE